ncbi:MAG: acyl-CoA dehydrogenase family protein [Micromonosporaceae bacterium]
MKLLLDTPLEADLRAGVRAMLADRCPPQRVLAGVESAEAYDRTLWRTLATEMGLAGLLIPERYGGAGAGPREAAVVCEELGRAVAPVPYLGSAVVAAAVLLAVDGSAPLAADDRELLGDLAAGTRVAVLAVPYSTPPFSAGVVASVTDRSLTGTVRGIADALGADILLVPAADGLYAVDAGAPGVERVAVASLDLTRPLCDLVLRGAPGRLVAAGPTAAAAVTAGLTAGAAMLAAEQVGLAEWCLDSTVEYVRGRYQFGRPVGSFQALKHRLADVWVGLTQARAVAGYAAACLGDNDPDTPVAVALAQAHCAGVAVTAAEECVQMHGGIGFTWEHPAHLYLKRAKADAVGFGTADRHRAALAELVDLPGAGR